MREEGVGFSRFEVEDPGLSFPPGCQCCACAVLLGWILGVIVWRWGMVGFWVGFDFCLLAALLACLLSG